MLEAVFRPRAVWLWMLVNLFILDGDAESGVCDKVSAFFNIYNRLAQAIMVYSSRFKIVYSYQLVQYGQSSKVQASEKHTI